MSAQNRAPVILDASAVLALINHEPGRDEVLACCEDPAFSVGMSAVNAAEVIAKLVVRGMPAAEAAATLRAVHAAVVPFTVSEAITSAEFIRPDTKGLSLGDRACLSTGRLRDALVLTADRAWQIPNLGVRVKTIR